MQIQDIPAYFPPALPEWPNLEASDDILPTLKKWHLEKRKIALATLIHIQGSAPRPLGSEMIINDRGEISGYISSGCVEAAITTEALASLADNKPRLLDYGAGSPIIDIVLDCGGRIKIFVRPLHHASDYITLREKAQKERRVLGLKTSLQTGEFFPLFDKDARQASTKNYFIRPYLPTTKLFLTGKDPIALRLLTLAKSFDIEPFLLRPLGPPTPPACLDPSHYDRRPIDKILETLTLDPYCAFYCLSHNLEEDCHFARHILSSEAFAMGILGSKKKKEKIISLLKNTSITQENLQRLSLPAGIDIKGKIPSEIALSILAEITIKRPRLFPYYNYNKENYDKNYDNETT